MGLSNHSSLCECHRDLEGDLDLRWQQGSSLFKLVSGCFRTMLAQNLKASKAATAAVTRLLSQRRTPRNRERRRKKTGNEMANYSVVTLAENM